MTIENICLNVSIFYLVKTLVDYIFLMLDTITGFNILFRDTKKWRGKNWFSRIIFLCLHSTHLFRPHIMYFKSDQKLD